MPTDKLSEKTNTHTFPLMHGFAKKPCKIFIPGQDETVVALGEDEVLIEVEVKGVNVDVEVDCPFTKATTPTRIIIPDKIIPILVILLY